MLITESLRFVNALISNFHCYLLTEYKNMDVERLKLLIRPADINELFSRLGARSQALDPSKEIIPVPSQCMV